MERKESQGILGPDVALFLCNRITFDLLCRMKIMIFRGKLEVKSTPGI